MNVATLGTILTESAGVFGEPERWAAAVSPGPRPYPSGGALYPVELLMFPVSVTGLAHRFWYYQCAAGRLVPATEERGVREVTSLCANACVADAAALVCLFVDFGRPSLEKYGSKAFRLLLLEAGHLAQNILLVAGSLGLASLPVCGFTDERLARAAGLEFPRQAIQYVIAIGGDQ